MTWRAVARGRASRGIHFPVSMGGKTVAVWMAHEACAFVLLETCVDEINGERLVFWRQQHRTPAVESRASSLPFLF
jgi:hypothetical protein